MAAGSSTLLDCSSGNCTTAIPPNPFVINGTSSLALDILTWQTRIIYLTHTGLVGWCLWTLVKHTAAHAWNQQPSTGRTIHLPLHGPPRTSLLPNSTNSGSQLTKGKGAYTWYSASLWISPQKRSGMTRVLKGSHSFTCTPTHQSAIGMSHTCLCLPNYSWYSFTDPGGMERWVGLGGWLHSETVYMPEGSHPSHY